YRAEARLGASVRPAEEHAKPAYLPGVHWRARPIPHRMELRRASGPYSHLSGAENETLHQALSRAEPDCSQESIERVGLHPHSCPELLPRKLLDLQSALRGGNCTQATVPNVLPVVRSSRSAKLQHT